MNENQLAAEIVRIAIKVHKELGPGLLEAVYKECLYFSIVEAGLDVQKEVPLPVIFHDIKLGCGYRIDLLIAKKILIEVKSVEAINDIHIAQTLTYLKHGNYKLGLLINFNVIYLKTGLRRVVNGLQEV
jgi:GxxExxY protein